VSIVDEANAPVAGASIVFPESGDGTAVQADDQGKYSWTNLPGDAVTLNVTAQGYIAAEQTATLNRGPNEITVALERDPFGILPVEACKPGENVLYLEDFQDGEAQDWPMMSASITGDMPGGWNLMDDNGNKILKIADAPTSGNDELQNHTFDNFMWRTKFSVTGNDADMFFMWRISHTDDGSRKRVVTVLGAANKPWMVRFLDSSTGPMAMNTAENGAMLNQGQWYDLVVTYFNGVHQVWYDGKLQLSYEDSSPFPAGTIGFEVHLEPGKVTQFLIDDMVVCELAAPYQP